MTASPALAALIPPSRAVLGATVVLLTTKWFRYDGRADLVRLCTKNFNLVDDVMDLEDGDGPQWRARNAHPHPIVKALAEELCGRKAGELIDLSDMRSPPGRCLIIVHTSKSGTFRVVPDADPNTCARIQKLQNNACDEAVWDDTRGGDGLLNVYGFIFSCLYPNETIEFSSNVDISLSFSEEKE